MSVYISVVSHGHADIIKKLNCLVKLSNKFHVIIKNNIEDLELSNYVKNTNVHLIDSNYGLGFGANNNFVYHYCMNHFEIKDDDFFIVLNPDVLIEESVILDLVNEMDTFNSNISTINLYRSMDKLIPDNSIRKFPTFIKFIKSFFGFKKSIVIDKNNISHPIHVDWAAGSFLAFRVSLYNCLNGFDEKYFMYCEDIDICFRSSMKGDKVLYHPNCEAFHFAKHANRNIFSKHFIWHLKSIFRFLFIKFYMTEFQSNT